jgi:sulfate transport system permease protein
MARRHSLPGFGFTLGYTVTWLTLLVLVPLSALALKSFAGGWGHFWQAVTDPRVIASYRLSFGVALAASLVNGFFGLLAAWVLARYDFPGRRLIDAAVDLPFALPTAVAGIALTALYTEDGWLGRWLAPHGIKVAFTEWGVFVALVFIGFPFVVRTVQPIVLSLSREVEEAAACLGADRWNTFRRVIFPALIPSLFTGITLAFGRAVGEFGSVIFISGNLPFHTEITPLLIVSKLEQFDYEGAAALGFIMLLASFGILTVSSWLQGVDLRRRGLA